MNISNDKNVMIFKNEKGYVVGITKKNQNGEYEKAYMPIQFNQGVELEDRTLIKIKNAWLSFYKWENQKGKGTTFYIRCSEFLEIEQENPYEEFGNNIKTKSEIGNQIEINDDDLPF